VRKEIKLTMYVTLISLIFLGLWLLNSSLAKYGASVRADNQIVQLLPYLKEAGTTEIDPRLYTSSTDYFNELGLGIWSNRPSHNFSMGQEDDSLEHNYWVELDPLNNNFCVVISWCTNEIGDDFEIAFVSDNLITAEPKEFWLTKDFSTVLDFSRMPWVGIVTKNSAKIYNEKSAFNGLRDIPYDCEHLVLRP